MACTSPVRCAACLWPVPVPSASRQNVVLLPLTLPRLRRSAICTESHHVIYVMIYLCIHTRAFAEIVYLYSVFIVIAGGVLCST